MTNRLETRDVSSDIGKKISTDIKGAKNKYNLSVSLPINSCYPVDNETKQLIFNIPVYKL